MAATRFLVRLGDEAVTVERAADDRVRVETDPPREARVMPLAGTGAYRVEIDERGRPVYVVGPPQQRWVYCEGHVYVVTVEPEGRARSPRAGVHGDSLSAPMPATVVSIAVAPGARVKHGDTVLMLEAMKMEMPIRAPHDGVVARIHCRVGDLVQPGVALLDFE